ncbi:unnamed protein product [Closterium sp. NIES-64]|nr:unnamed protein product [Closterium sp. NIES-64]
MGQNFLITVEAAETQEELWNVVGQNFLITCPASPPRSPTCLSCIFPFTPPSFPASPICLPLPLCGLPFQPPSLAPYPLVLRLFCLQARSVRSYMLNGTTLAVRKLGDGAFDLPSRCPSRPPDGRSMMLSSLQHGSQPADPVCGDGRRQEQQGPVLSLTFPLPHPTPIPTSQQNLCEVMADAKKSKDDKLVKTAILRVVYYWYNFSPLSRGSAMAGYSSLLGPLSHLEKPPTHTLTSHLTSHLSHAHVPTPYHQVQLLSPVSGLSHGRLFSLLGLFLAAGKEITAKPPPDQGRPAQSLPQAGAVKPPVKQEPGGAAAGGAAGAAGPAGGAGGKRFRFRLREEGGSASRVQRGAGRRGGDLSQSECGHMSLCNACGRSMAEKQATCQQCGAVVDKLVKEFLVRVKPAKARTRPLLLEDDTGQASYVGHMEGGWQHSAYYLLVMHGKEFVAIPASQWYAFGKQAQYKTLTLEEAELCMQSKRRKADGFRKWLTKEESEKLLAGGGKEGGGGGRGGGRKKGGLDDGLGSDDEGMGGDMEDGEGRKRGQGKKGGDDDDDELPKEEFELEMDGDKGERDLTCVALRMKTYVMARRLLKKKGGGDEDDEVPKEEFELEVDGDKGQDWEHDELLSDDDEATAMQPEDEKEQESSGGSSREGLKRKDLEKGAAGGGASGAGAGAKKGKVEPGKRTPPLPAKREPGAGGSAAGKAGGGTSGGGASGAAAGPKPTAVTEEAVKGILRQAPIKSADLVNRFRSCLKTAEAPIKSADLVNRFRSCLKTAEDKKRFQEIIKRVGKIQAVNGEKFIVLR